MKGTYKLKEPFTFEGKEYKELEYDFSKVKGKHMRYCIDYESPTEIPVKIALCAMDLPSTFAEELSGRDWMELANLGNLYMAS